MLSRVLRTDNDPAALMARVALGVVMFPHGAQKALGWFGGGGFRGTMDGFANMEIPAPLAFLAILAEFAGSMGLVLGLFTRIAAFGVLQHGGRRGPGERPPWLLHELVWGPEGRRVRVSYPRCWLSPGGHAPEADGGARHLR